MGCHDGFGGEEGASWYQHCVAGRCSEKEKRRRREMLGMRSFVLQKWEMVAYRRALVFNSYALNLRNIAAASRVLLDE